MKHKIVPTFTATIWVGRKVRDTGKVFPKSVAIEVIQKWVNSIGFCVSVTPTTFQYTNGSEPGFAIGIINYPRFPSTSRKLQSRALELGELLRVALHQYKVSIVFPDKTVMLGEAE